MMPVSAAEKKLPTVDTSKPERMDCAPSANLFNEANWNFEEGEKFWRLVNYIDDFGSMYYYVAEVTEENPHDGKKSLQINGVGSWSHMTIPIMVKKNTTYTFSMWVCATPGLGGQANTIYKWFAIDSNDPEALKKGVQKQLCSQDLSITTAYDGKWHQVGCTINTNDFEQIALYIGDGGGNIFIDEIRFFETNNPDGKAATKLARLDAIKAKEAESESKKSNQSTTTKSSGTNRTESTTSDKQTDSTQTSLNSDDTTTDTTDFTDSSETGNVTETITSEPSSTEPADSGGEGNKSLLGLWIALVVIVLGGGFAFFFFLIRPKIKKAE